MDERRDKEEQKHVAAIDASGEICDSRGVLPLLNVEIWNDDCGRLEVLMATRRAIEKISNRDNRAVDILNDALDFPDERVRTQVSLMLKSLSEEG